jgi:predicted MPP superfamily phosphohydrolase
MMPRWFGVSIFFLVVFTIWAVLHFYVYHRVAFGLRLQAHGRLYLKIALIFLASIYPLVRLLTRDGVSLWEKFLYFPAASYLGFFSLLITGFLLFEVFGTLPAHLAIRSGVLPSSKEFLEKLALFRVLFAFSCALILGVYGIFVVAKGPEIKVVEVYLRNLPQKLDGIKIAHLSDIHAGGALTRSYFERIVQKTSSLGADIVAITGDITDEPNGQSDEIIRELSNLKSRLGVFAVSGNHEYYTGKEETLKGYMENGLRVLRQEHVIIENILVLAGIDDPSFLGGRNMVEKAIEKAFEGAPDGLPKILLSHQPVGLEFAGKKGVDLMLCGHTHGGQLPPIHLMSKIAYGILHGLENIGNMKVYVTSGAGFWGPPMRVFADPEIALIVLRALEKAQP